MVHRFFLGVALFINLGFVANVAAKSEPPICGIALDQDSKHILNGFIVLSVGDILFADPGSPNKKIFATRYYLRTRATCSHLQARESDADDVPDFIVDIAGLPHMKVIAFAYRPALRRCSLVNRLIASELGPANAANAETAEWIQNESRVRIILTEYDGECWIHRQRISN